MPTDVATVIATRVIQEFNERVAKVALRDSGRGGGGGGAAKKSTCIPLHVRDIESARTDGNVHEVYFKVKEDDYPLFKIVVDEEKKTTLKTRQITTYKRYEHCHDKRVDVNFCLCDL